MSALGKRSRGQEEDSAQRTAPAAARRKKSKSEVAEEKAQKHELLSAFFRVYLLEDEGSAVLKNAIFNLYSLKVPVLQQLARNALYRHMWARYAGSIAVHQSHYKEYIKGLKMRISEEECDYPQFAADRELLRSYGVNELFDFEGVDITVSPAPQPTAVKAREPPLLQRVEELEQMAKSLLEAVTSIKAAMQRPKPS